MVLYIITNKKLIYRLLSVSQFSLWVLKFRKCCDFTGIQAIQSNPQPIHPGNGILRALGLLVDWLVLSCDREINQIMSTKSQTTPKHFRFVSAHVKKQKKLQVDYSHSLLLQGLTYPLINILFRFQSFQLPGSAHSGMESKFLIFSQMRPSV